MELIFKKKCKKRTVQPQFLVPKWAGQRRKFECGWYVAGKDTFNSDHYVPYYWGTLNQAKRLNDLQRVASRDSRSKKKQKTLKTTKKTILNIKKHLFLALRLKVGACQVLPRQSQGRCGGTLWIAVPRGNGYCRWVPQLGKTKDIH